MKHLFRQNTVDFQWKTAHRKNWSNNFEIKISFLYNNFPKLKESSLGRFSNAETFITLVVQ